MRLIIRTSFIAAIFAATLFPTMASARGLDPWAKLELHSAGVDKYLGEYTPVSTEEVGDGWVKHTFDAGQGGEGLR